MKRAVSFPGCFKKICYGWLLVAVLGGLLLRWMLVQRVDGVNYRYLLHTHSHLALLGWIWGGFYLLLSARFLGDGFARRGRALFWFMQATLVGMLLTFPFQGYAAASIAFSTLFVIGTYIFSWWILRYANEKPVVTRTLLKSAVAFLFVSSFGPYGLGYFMSQGMGDSPWYSNSIYFYLHFLYNGFFFFGLLAVVFDTVGETVARAVPAVEAYLFALGGILSFSLSILWMEPGPLYYGVGAAGAALQFLIVCRWAFLLWRYGALERLVGLWRPVGGVVALFVIAKYGMQLVSAAPEIATWLYQSQRYTIIGYIHFVMLGILSPFLFGFLFSDVRWNLFGKASAACCVLGFVVTEALLFGGGLSPEIQARLPMAPLLFAGYGLLVVGLVGLGVMLVVERRDA